MSNIIAVTFFLWTLIGLIAFVIWLLETGGPPDDESLGQRLCLLFVFGPILWVLGGIVTVIEILEDRCRISRILEWIESVIIDAYDRLKKYGPPMTKQRKIDLLSFEVKSAERVRTLNEGSD